MGRKIPGKKHRGVKDPFEQQAKRNERLKNKINAPPVDPDDQEIPKSVLEINRLRQMVKDGKFKQKKKKKKFGKALLDISKFCSPGPKLPGMVQRDKLFPKLRQVDGESEASFLNRINAVTEDIIKEASIESKYSVSINRNSDGSIKEIEADEIADQFSKQNTNKRKKNVKNKKAKVKLILNDERSPKLNKKQRLKLKKRKKRLESEQSAAEFKTDKVKFGEVVHAPPNLRVRPKGSSTTSVDKPGNRSLLLNQLVNRSRNKH